MLLKIGEHILETELPAYCQKFSQRWVIITDSNLENTLGKTLQACLTCELIAFPAGEEHKTRETKQYLEDKLLEKSYGRDTALIALGGGMVTDLVGFLASTYCRGIPVVYVPTTLLAMVDASIGGKTGVDTPFGKNLIGAFYLPKAVFMDITTLNTLPEKGWRDGMVETLKHALIRDKSLWDELKFDENLINIIHQSVAIKQHIVNQDTHDHGIRQLLNFGHTIGHAIETIENYQVSHGEAVAIGLLVEAYLSVLCGFLDFSVVKEIENTLRYYQLPLKTNAFQDTHYFKQVMGLDKKAKKNIPHFVLLDAIGKAHQENKQYSFGVTKEHLDNALAWARELYS